MAIFVAVATAFAQPALAELPCGPKPQIAVEGGANPVKDDVQAKSQLIRQAPENAALRTLVAATRIELRDKYSTIDKSLVDHYFMWVICTNISSDPDLVPSQKYNVYATLYRLMSEPLGPGAHPPQ